MALEHGVMLSKTSPAFLHANSTSHTWCFSAVAEIIDNAYDPDVGATELRIDKVMIKDEVCLAFTDNGAGMTPDKLHQMLSFGYCEKVEIRGHKPVGQYGNGFKSGSMRLGKDAIVFTKSRTTWSVGFLSQTFLATIKADTVLVPIITFDKAANRVVNRDDTDGSLRSIFSHSIFTTMKSILKEYSNLDGHDTGTRIIIYNLKRGTDAMLELDFDSNPRDIINSEHHEFDNSNARIVKEYTPEYRRSLKEYCSILFLKPRMKILVRGEKVRTKLISKSLQKMEVALYRPRFLLKPVKIILGFSTSNEDFGMMLYNKNRLIKAYERVGCQRQMSGQGVGVVGVVEVDFLEPIHNKQDFNKTDRYNAFMNVLSQKLNDYWQEKTNTTDSAPTVITTPWIWAQCDNPKCLKWRRMPLGVTSESLPDKWFCYMNLDPTHNRCEIEEEPEDEDALIEQGNTYEKRVKKQKSTEQQNRTQAINQREESLKQREAELLRVKKEIENIRPLQEVNGSDGLTRAELEQARQQLEEARRREEEQRRIIEDLKRQKQHMEQQQKRLGQAIMGDTLSVASISNIALHGSQEAPTPKRKRKPCDDTPKTSKKRSNQNGATNSISIPETAIVEDDDETRDVKPTLIVKLPRKSRDTGDIIVIDSESDHSDDEMPSEAAPEVLPHHKNKESPAENTPHTKGSQDKGSGVRKERGSGEMPSENTPNPRGSRDKGPAVRKEKGYGEMPSELLSTPEIPPNCENKDTPVESTPNTNGSRDKESAVKKEKGKSNAGKASDANLCSVDVPLVPTKCTRNVRTQTLFPEDPGNAVQQLNSLRSNVAKLLRVILPDMSVFANIALENVDNALIEVLRVNDVTSDDQPQPSAQTAATTNPETSKENSKVPAKSSKRRS